MMGKDKKKKAPVDEFNYDEAMLTAFEYKFLRGSRTHLVSFDLEEAERVVVDGVQISFVRDKHNPNRIRVVLQSPKRVGIAHLSYGKSKIKDQ